MPATAYPFIELNHVDSTNNYAMASVHAGMAKHGNAVFSHSQSEGKGQRGKLWQTSDGQNIALSVVIEPQRLKLTHPFQLSVAVALAAYRFLSKYAVDETSIKWPNDIYWRDRKAAGILIENVFKGKNWKWAVAGIGININQITFDTSLKNPISLRQITGKEYDVVLLARELQHLIIETCAEFFTKQYEDVLTEYHHHLYKLNTLVRLKKNTIVFETMVKGVSMHGQLITVDAVENFHEFGEIEWLL